jgi:hypothetical protein
MNLLTQETCPQTDDTRLIPLSRGLFAKISLADYDRVSQFKWFAHWDSHTKSFYAVRSLYLPGEGTNGRKFRIRQVSLARFILGLEFGDKRIADHINHDTLDDTRDNLRRAHKQGSGQNQRRRSNNTTGFKGVSVYRRNGKIVGCIAQIRHAGKTIHIGVYKTDECEKAHAAYCAMARKLNGEFARTE